MPVLELIDARLAEGETDGWRYDDMPEDGEAWRRRSAYLDDDADRALGAGFAELDRDQQAAADPGRAGPRPATTGTGCRPTHVWSLWTRYACAAFYSHPWAWNEIGFGGPAYPRGYKNSASTGASRGRCRTERRPRSRSEVGASRTRHARRHTAGRRA